MKEIKVVYKSVDKVMRKTKQIRVSEESWKYLKDIAHGSMTISKLGDKGISLLKKEKSKNLLEYEQKMAILFPNRKIKSGHNASKTPSVSELSTIMKDLKSGKIWTSSKYSSDNDNETKV